MASPYKSTQKAPLLSENVEKGTDLRKQDENCETPDLQARPEISTRCSLFTLVILTFMHLLTFMASSTVSGVIPSLRTAFNMDDNRTGLISIVFISFFVLFSQVFGFLGDSWNRKYIMCTGMTFWSVVGFLRSFIPNEQYTAFLLINGLVGGGGASLSTIAPSIIANLYVGDQRSRALSIFNLAAPCGTGLGYIIGSKVTSAAGGDWRWALRINPALGIIGVVLMAVFVKEPSREAAEENNSKPLSLKRWISDVKQLLITPSFIFCTLGSMTVKFTAGAMGALSVGLLTRARNITQDNPMCETAVCAYDDRLIYGIVKVISGIVGILAGAAIAKRYQKYNPRADPIVCGIGLWIATIFLFLAVYLANISIVATYVFIFFAEVFLMLNISISVDIRLYVVSPTRQSTGLAMSMMFSRMLGDAGSPYYIGLISQYIHRHHPDTALWRFLSLQYTLMACPVVVFLGGGLFLVSAHFIEKDRKKAETESEDSILKEVVVTSP